MSSLSPHLSSSRFLFLATDNEIVRVDPEVGLVRPGYPLQSIYTNFASDERRLCVGSASLDTGNKYIHLFTVELDRMEQVNIFPQCIVFQKKENYNFCFSVD